MTLSAKKKKTHARRRFFPTLRYRHNVDCAKFPAVFRIGFGFKSHLLPFFQCAETLGLNRREMYENIVSAFVVGNKSIALSVIEPFYSSVHFTIPPVAPAETVLTVSLRHLIHYTKTKTACQYCRAKKSVNFVNIFQAEQRYWQ